MVLKRKNVVLNLSRIHHFRLCFATRFHVTPGHPFMQSLRENTALWRLTLLLYGIMAALALEIVPPVNRMLQLASFPSISLRLAFTALLTIDTVVVLLIDRACLVLFKGG